MRFILIFATPFLCAAASALTINASSEADWGAEGAQIWSALQRGNAVSFKDTSGGAQTATTVGFADLMGDSTPENLEIDAQYNADFTDSQGHRVKMDLKAFNDPIESINAAVTGGSFLNLPVPFDHDAGGHPLGLRVATDKSSAVMGGAFNRLGIRFVHTPPGRLLFLYEMSNADEEGARWYAREFTVPVSGCPWRPAAEIVDRAHPETHLRKLAVLQLEPWHDPAGAIPEKLHRQDLKIDLDAGAAGLDWEGLKKWMTANIKDDLIPAGGTYVIQLPAGVVEDEDCTGVQLTQWTPAGRAVHSLTGGRKVWLVGHPDTVIASFRSMTDNLGLLFCRITRITEKTVADERTDGPGYDNMVLLSGRNIDFRNNWIECPDGAAGFGVQIPKLEEATVLDNIISGTGAGLSTGGTSKLTKTILARNWIERGYDAVQMYGSWVDTVLAYNHFAGASGFPNRSAKDGHLGANLHSDEFQSQANQTDRRPQSIMIFCNFSQFGRHNWPPAWAELGGTTQNIIIDSDAYVNSHIYWNIFQNLMPAGHRGIGTLSPDIDWVMANSKARKNDYIRNFSIIGNAFLERWDHNNSEYYGYMNRASGIGGSLSQPFFELVASENAYTRTHLDRQCALFKQIIESRPDASVHEGWMQNAPSLTNVYEHPITFTGSWDTFYKADFSGTSHAGDKLLEGFVEPLDYAPRKEWFASPGGAARLTPRSELEKVAPMPVDLAGFLGDASRKGSFFDEFSGPVVSAKKTVLESPWRASAPDNGFLLHIKFGSAGTPGTLRELLSETDGSKRYEVFLTEQNTARYRLFKGGKLLSEVESTDTFKDGDHLTMQVYTPFAQVVPEINYPTMLLLRNYENGVRKIRYVSQNSAPEIQNPEPDTKYVWMDPTRNFRFYEWRAGEWAAVNSGMDSVYGCAVRSSSENRKDSFHRLRTTITNGTPENYWRDMFPLTPGEWHTIYLDGSGSDSTSEWKSADLRWVYTPNAGPASVTVNLDGKSTGANSFFNGMAVSSGRPRCFIRHNIDHQDKKWDWTWTPDEDLPRGKVTLFGSFDGSYESFSVIRGGQGEYGLPPNAPAYRVLETIGAVMSFIRKPLDEKGTVSGWGTPEIYLNASIQ